MTLFYEYSKISLGVISFITTFFVKICRILLYSTSLGYLKSGSWPSLGMVPSHGVCFKSNGTLLPPLFTYILHPRRIWVPQLEILSPTVFLVYWYVKPLLCEAWFTSRKMSRRIITYKVPLLLDTHKLEYAFHQISDMVNYHNMTTSATWTFCASSSWIVYEHWLNLE